MKKALSLFILGIILLTACQKQLGFEDIPTVPVPKDSTYLEKIDSYDSTTGKIILYATTYYEYDDLKRVTRKTERDVVFGYDFSVFTYYYTGNGMLPSRALAVYYTGPTNTVNENDTVNTYYTYNSESLNIKDSINSYLHSGGGSENYSINREVYTYQYSPGKVFIEHRSKGTVLLPLPSATTSFSFDTLLLDNNSNIKMYRVYFQNGSTGEVKFGYQREYSYDDKPNPLVRLSDFRTLERLERNKNNMLTIKDSSAFGGSFEDRSMEFIYRADGYPLIRKYPYISLSGHFRKFVFTYKGL